MNKHDQARVAAADIAFPDPYVQVREHDSKNIRGPAVVDPADPFADFFAQWMAIPPLGEWAKRSACKPYPKTTFFPINQPEKRRAVAICAECPVRAECLEFALEYSKLKGVWGGVDERERRKIRRERAKVSTESTA